MKKEYLVTKSNSLITCNYDLSVQEQKIILTLASMVQPDDTEFKEYKFKIKDFMNLLGIKDKSKYKEIPKITKELMKKVFEIKEGKDILQLAWLCSARYKTGEGMVILKFAPDLKPYMLELKGLHTSYKLENILSLKSKYSIRLYEILKSNLFKKHIEIELEELKNMVCAKEKAYSIYNNFKNKVILQAHKELAEKTDISFEFEEIKTGRKVTSIKFYIINNKAMNEIACDKIHSDDVMNSVFITKVFKIMNLHKIDPIEAKKIYDTAKGNFEIIEKCYAYCCEKKVGSIVAYMLKLVKPNEFIEPKENIPQSNFTNYEQRNYDFDALEKKLLGWDQK